MKNYVEVVLVSRVRSPDGSVFAIKEFRNCRVEDFEQNGIQVDERFKSLLVYRLCPDVDEAYNYYRVMNSYSNTTHRESFSVELWKCNSNINTNCKSDDEIQDFLRSFYFTFYTVYEKIQFSNNAELNSDLNEPKISTDIFHS